MSQHLVLHALAVKKHAEAAAVAQFTGLSRADVDRLLAAAVQSGRVVETQGKFMLAPLARMALHGQYALECAELREDSDFLEAYASFERINVHLKALITDWQTMEVGGIRVTNMHADSDYDLKLIEQLGSLHERADQLFARFIRAVPRFEYYRRGLEEALERAEAGAYEWVSDARLASYHTLWFELHEDLLRLLSCSRTEGTR